MIVWGGVYPYPATGGRSDRPFADGARYHARVDVDVGSSPAE